MTRATQIRRTLLAIALIAAVIGLFLQHFPVNFPWSAIPFSVIVLIALPGLGFALDNGEGHWLFVIVCGEFFALAFFASLLGLWWFVPILLDITLEAGIILHNPGRQQ